MRLSIIIPSYNGSAILREALPPFIAWMKDHITDFEIIVVDDGSGDGAETKRVAEQNGCRFIGYAKNLGKGGAVRTGMREAKGDACIFTDVDIPFEYESMLQFEEYIREKEFDVVIGDRRLPGSKYFSEIKGMRKLGSRIFTFFVGRFVTTGLFDTQCGMKAFSRRTVDDIFSVARINSFAFDVELLYISLKRNYDIKRLPVRFRSSHDNSNVSLMRHAPGMLMDLFRVKWNHMRGRYNRVERRNG